MAFDYLYELGFDTHDIEELTLKTDDKTYSELSLFSGLIKENIKYMKDFGASNYIQVVTRFPEIFLRDAESFKNIFSKFDRDDLIQKVEKNPAVFKKMVEFVDNN